jgi:hypothetical protein
MPPFTRTRRLALGGALAATAALFAAPAALAGDAYIDGDGLAHFTANFGEDNSLRVAERPHPNPGFKFVIFSDVVPVTAKGTCGQVGATAECTVPVGQSFIRADLATLDDRIEPALTGAPASFGFSAEGNPGDDVLGGSARRDLLYGGDGDDSIVGRLGNDHLEGGWGNDSITGGVGEDDMFGGPAADTINANDGDGTDDIDCGAGNDLVIYNPGDTIENCERTQLIIP